MIQIPGSRMLGPVSHPLDILILIGTMGIPGARVAVILILMGRGESIRTFLLPTLLFMRRSPRRVRMSHPLTRNQTAHLNLFRRKLDLAATCLCCVRLRLGRQQRALRLAGCPRTCHQARKTRGQGGMIFQVNQVTLAWRRK